MGAVERWDRCSLRGCRKGNKGSWCTASPYMWLSDERVTVTKSHKLPKLSQGEADNPDRPVSGKGIGFVAEHHSSKETTDPVASPKLRLHKRAIKTQRPFYTNCPRR